MKIPYCCTQCDLQVKFPKKDQHIRKSITLYIIVHEHDTTQVFLKYLVNEINGN